MQSTIAILRHTVVNVRRRRFVTFPGKRMQEIFRNFSDIQVSKQVKQRKTAIHESIHHQFIIHRGRVQTSGPLTIMTFSVIELFFNLIRSLLGDIVDISCLYQSDFLLCFNTFLCHKLSENFRGIFPEKYGYFSGNFRKNSAGNFLNFPNLQP